MPRQKKYLKLHMTPITWALVTALPQLAWAQSASDPTATAEKSLATVNVSASAEPATKLPAPYAGGQVAKGARLGLLGNQDVMDTPFNVTSYTSELIENQSARTLADVMANDPGVRFTTSSGHQYENFRIRGFSVNQNDIAINGMYGMAPTGHVPVEMLERVEVLKGPNGLFSGMAPSGAVGGVINLVPKRAGDDPLTRVSVDYESASQAGTRLDIGRRFGEDKALGLRVNSAYSDGDTTLNGQSKKREFLSAALDYRTGTLTTSLDAYHSKESFSGGTPAMFIFGSTTTNIPAAPDPSTNQFPSGYGELQSDAVMARAEYEINRDLSAFANVGKMHNDSSGFINSTMVRTINAVGTGVSPATYTLGQRIYSDNLASEAGLRSRLSTGAVSHELVLQASRLGMEAGSGTNSQSSTYVTNIYNPSYQAMPALPSTTYKTSDTTLSSLALVDTLSFMSDKVRLTLGARNQQVKVNNFNTSGAITSAYDKSAVTPVAAIVFKPWTQDVSLYANYVQGLSQGDTVSDTAAANHTTNGTVFAPYKAEQQEVGIKWNAGRFTHTASLFEITKPMMVKLGSSSNYTYSDDGEKRVRGLEWNTFGEAMRGLRLLGGAAYSQGVQTKTALDANDGKTAVGVPSLQGNLGAEWDTPWVHGLALSGRMIATSSQYMDSANTQKIPGWSQFDAGARYATQLDGRKLVLRLNVTNLFNRAYYSGSFSDTTPVATLGPARTVSASATMDF